MTTWNDIFAADDLTAEEIAERDARDATAEALRIERLEAAGFADGEVVLCGEAQPEWGVGNTYIIRDVRDGGAKLWAYGHSGDDLENINIRDIRRA